MSRYHVIANLDSVSSVVFEVCDCSGKERSHVGYLNVLPGLNMNEIRNGWQLPESFEICKQEDMPKV